MFVKRLSLLVLTLFLIGGCSTRKQIEAVLRENPDILFAALARDPLKTDEMLTKVSKESERLAKAQLARIKAEKREEDFANPKVPLLQADRPILGEKKAPILIVQYIDFQCPYCKQGAAMLKAIAEKYPGKIQIFSKHLPLASHPMAEKAAQYYETIALQDPKKAIEFSNQILENQERLKIEGESFLQDTAKVVHADLTRLKKELFLGIVKEKLESDVLEASIFGFYGTPSYLVNGVRIEGLTHISIFEELIERHLRKAETKSHT